MFPHAFASRRIRKSSVTAAHIVDDMFDLAGLGRHAVYGGIRNDILQRKLRPRLAVKLRGPVR